MRIPTGETRVVQLRRSRLWVVVGCPWRDVRWCGPYRTRKDAEGVYGLRGIRQAVRNTAALVALLICSAAFGSSQNLVTQDRHFVQLDVAEYNTVVGGMGFPWGGPNRYLLAWEPTDDEPMAVVDWAALDLSIDLLRLRYTIIYHRGVLMRIAYRAFYFTESSRDRQCECASVDGCYRKFWPLSHSLRP